MLCDRGTDAFDVSPFHVYLKTRLRHKLLGLGTRRASCPRRRHRHRWYHLSRERADQIFVAEGVPCTGLIQCIPERTPRQRRLNPFPVHGGGYGRLCARRDGWHREGRLPTFTLRPACPQALVGQAAREDARECGALGLRHPRFRVYLGTKATARGRGTGWGSEHGGGVWVAV